MSGDKSRFTDFVLKEGGYDTFGDNNKGIIMGEGNLRSPLGEPSALGKKLK